MPKAIILDCDPGFDDVFAIWLASAHPAIDLKAITTVAGNGTIDHTSRNARIACTVAKISDIPIAAGADSPLAQELKTADWIHGPNALGGINLPELDTPLDARTAQELIRDVLTESDRLVTIAATGPLTNIATFVERQPELSRRIERIVWMGGSTGRGNVSAYAEFNASTDPEALDTVVKSGIPFTMVGLNITHQAQITREVRARIRAVGNATASFGAELLERFCSSYDAFGEMPDGPLHDPITVALIADPEVATTVKTRLDVELRGDHTRGVTVVDLLELSSRPKNVTVALELDVDRYWALIEGAIRSLA